MSHEKPKGSEMTSATDAEARTTSDTQHKSPATVEGMSTLTVDSDSKQKRFRDKEDG